VRKFISVVVIATLLMTSAVPAFGQTMSEAAMLERAIQNARAVVYIPNAASIFESSSWDDPSTGRVWSLNWRDPNHEMSFSVTIDSRGTVLNFWSFERGDREGLSMMSRAEGQRIAEAFLSNVIPDAITDMRLRDALSSTDTFSFTYMAYVNNFPVSNLMFFVEVNKFTERVASYRSTLWGDFDNNFTVPENMISEAEAIRSFLENDGVSLVYNSSFDWRSRELTIFPSYIINPSRFINAETGELVHGAGMMALFGRAEAVGGEVAEDSMPLRALTPEEQGAVDDIAGVITREQAVRAAISHVPGLTNSSEVTWASLSGFHDGRSGHFWSLNFDDNIVVAIDANNRNLLSFSNFSPFDDRGRNAISYERAERIARDFMASVASNKVNQVTLLENPHVGIQPLGGEAVFHTFTFVREVNGIPFLANTISITVESATGTVRNFNLVWHYDAQFPSISNIISAEEAFGIFASESGFDLLYTRAMDDRMTLVYGLLSTPQFVINPADGTKLDHSGNPFVDRRAAISYDDIDGRWYELFVTALLDNGFFLEGRSFNGSAPITQEEFLRFLHSPSQAFFTQEEFYNMLVSTRTITRDEIAPDSIVTRQEAARFVVRHMGLQRAAQDGSIFINPFADVVSDNFLGYAALARALRIMTGDPAGNFNGHENLNRAQAAVVIHNLLRAM